MAWINIENPENDEQANNVKTGNEKANILNIHSSMPSIMQKHEDLYRAIMFERSPLTRAQREMIAVVVSVINMCEY